MLPAVLLGAGLVMKGYGTYMANMAQAEGERKNASWYREQADFAKKSGERQQMIFDRESQVLYGEQLGAFTKAGVDTSASSYFVAKQMLFRQQESYAIKQEADMNTRLAMLKADQAERNASQLSDPMNNLLQFGGSAMSAASGVLN
jgi:hypothetical protein